MLQEPQYAKFWDRVGAYILDVIIIGLFTFGINYLNLISLQSFYVYLSITVLALLYKAFMESRYQATWGKMALNLKVTDCDFKQIDFERSILRSLIFLIPTLIALPVFYLAFENPDLIPSEGYWKFIEELSVTYPFLNSFNSVYSLVIFADLILLLVDRTKKNRSLKDRIAKTYVLKFKTEK